MVFVFWKWKWQHFMVTNNVFNMKKNQLIIIIWILLAFSCSKRPSLAIERTPFVGNELRTDGFYYYNYYPNSHWDTTNRSYIFFFFFFGTILKGYVYKTINIQDITIDMIKEQSKYTYKDSGSWGLFAVKDSTIYWSFWHYQPDFHTYVSLDSAKILNDTTFYERIKFSDGQIVDHIYHFHKFPHKPDSSIAYQWIP